MELVTVVEVPPFPQQADKVWSHKEREAFIGYIAANPEAGQEISGTGGVRKIRWGQKQKGKRGGVRVIYYFYNNQHPLFLISVYPKSKQEDITPDQERKIIRFTKNIKAKLKINKKGDRHV